MNTVWRESKAGGTLLLLAIAIADHARDNGWAWPGIDSLAKKTRMSVRSVTDLVAKLEDMGELMVDRNAGPRGTNMYLLLLVSKGKITAVDSDETPATSAPLQLLHPATFRGELHPNHKEPPLEEEEEKGCTEWPDLEAVLKAANEYPGSMARGIPAIIPKGWAEYHFHHRTHERQSWAKDWKAAMVSLFELQWQNGQAAARGSQRQGSSGQAVFGYQKKNGAAGQRERGEILQELALAKKTGAPVEQLRKELATV